MSSTRDAASGPPTGDRAAPRPPARRPSARGYSRSARWQPHADDADLHAPGLDPLLHVAAVADQERDRDLGILRPEGADQRRQHVLAGDREPPTTSSPLTRPWNWSTACCASAGSVRSLRGVAEQQLSGRRWRRRPGRADRAAGRRARPRARGRARTRWAESETAASAAREKLPNSATRRRSRAGEGPSEREGPGRALRGRTPITSRRM